MIMAGGAGKRLWPMSQPGQPKQLIPFLHGGQCLLDLAAARVQGLVASERLLICTGEAYRAPILDRLKEWTTECILGEPEGRDTLNAVGFTAAVLAKTDPDAIFAVLTADHVIEPVDVFQQHLETGFALIEDDPQRIVTFGITPTFPATGFGYVETGDAISEHAGAFLAKRFVEKPDEATAQSYLDAGTFTWNSGMFVFHAATVLEDIRRHHPDAAAGLEQIARAWGTPQQDEVLQRVYPTLPKTSIDFGIMEPVSSEGAGRICVVPMELTWLDVGSWPAFGDTLSADSNGNRGMGRRWVVDSTNTLVVSDDPDHEIAVIGIDDVVIVHTSGQTLVCHKDHAQKVKDAADASF
jgi:mannose-1-phosphate guanylyltransferase